MRICVRRTNFSHSWRENRAIPVPFAATSADTVSPKISLFNVKIGCPRWRRFISFTSWSLLNHEFKSVNPTHVRNNPGPSANLSWKWVTMSSGSVLQGESLTTCEGYMACSTQPPTFFRSHQPMVTNHQGVTFSLLNLQHPESLSSKVRKFLYFFGGGVYLKSLDPANKKARKKNPVVLCRPWDCEGFPSPHHWSDHPTLAGLAECPPVLLVLVTSNRVSETNLKSTYPPRPEPNYVK